MFRVKELYHLLTMEQQDFFMKVIPLGVLIQDWTHGKSQFRGKVYSPAGILAPIVIADILHKSNIGSHPISHPEYKGKYANNLVLLESGKLWGGKSHNHDGKTYRAYKTWRDFAVDFSDYIAFSGLYDAALRCNALHDQLSAYCESDRCYNKDSLLELIDTYHLAELQNGKRS